MRTVAIRSNLEVFCDDGRSVESTGTLFASYAGKRVTVASSLLSFIAGRRWVPTFPAADLLRICRAEVAEALLSRDPDALDVEDLRWGRQLRSSLSSEYRFPWIRGAAPRPARPKSEPLVSIVLPTFNGVRFLEESIQSCLDQTHRRLEVLVVDDGSKADVWGVVSRFSDGRLRYIRHERNQGIAAGLNTGFRNSTGELVTWTSDDNFYEPAAVETLVSFLSRYPEIDFVYADSFMIDEAGQPFGAGILRTRPVSELAIANGIGACFLYRRRVYESVGNYDSAAFLAEDYDYWIRVSKRFRMQRLAIPLYHYRYHPDSLTGRYADSEIKAKAASVQRKHEAVAR